MTDIFGKQTENFVNNTKIKLPTLFKELLGNFKRFGIEEELLNNFPDSFKDGQQLIQAVNKFTKDPTKGITFKRENVKQAMDEIITHIKDEQSDFNKFLITPALSKIKLTEHQAQLFKSNLSEDIEQITEKTFNISKPQLDDIRNLDVPTKTSILGKLDTSTYKKIGILAGIGLGIPVATSALISLFHKKESMKPLLELIESEVKNTKEKQVPINQRVFQRVNIREPNIKKEVRKEVNKQLKKRN